MRWLLVLGLAACFHGGAAPSADCDAVAGHVTSLLGGPSERSGRVAKVFADRCIADGWQPDVRDCIVATPSLRDPRHCKARLPGEERAALERDLAAADATPAAACERFHALIDRLSGCTRMSAEEREAYGQYGQVVRLAWSSASEAARTQLEAGCRDRATALRAACGW